MNSPVLNRAFLAALVFCVVTTASLLALRPFVAEVAFAPDQGFNWYFWKRPDPDIWSRASMWTGYLSHQLFFWGLIWWAKKNRKRWQDRSGLHLVNWVGLGGTALFVGLHALQTAMFYDGLGQDLPVIMSQGSVVILLVLVLLMEAPRRGLFFGSGKSWFAAVRPMLIQYHGYYFAWATVFTFWYHPMDLTLGHLTGFLYMFLLFMQGAFMFTRIHSNRVWTFVLEVSVVVHALAVAYVAGQEIWPMFAFGFLMLVVVTQMHGLGWSRATRWTIAALYLVAMLWVYSARGFDKINEVIRIPVIDYVLVALIGGFLLLGLRLSRSGDSKGP